MSRRCNPPKWATDLVAEVCRSHGKKQPQLTWRRERGRHTSGTYYPSRHSITMVVGQNPIGNRVVLLHELAHAMAPLKTRKINGVPWGKVSRSHDKVFWAKAWKLYAKYGMPLEYAKKCEFWYKTGAKRAYYRVKPWQLQKSL